MPHHPCSLHAQARLAEHVPEVCRPSALLPFLLEMTEFLAPLGTREEVEGLTESDWTFLGQIP